MYKTVADNNSVIDQIIHALNLCKYESFWPAKEHAELEKTTRKILVLIKISLLDKTKKIELIERQIGRNHNALDIANIVNDYLYADNAGHNYGLLTVREILQSKNGSNKHWQDRLQVDDKITFKIASYL